MSYISLEKAIARIQENDSKFAIFVNGTSTDVYKTSDNQQVKSIQNFLHEKSAEIDTLLTINNDLLRAEIQEALISQAASILSTQATILKYIKLRNN